MNLKLKNVLFITIKILLVQFVIQGFLMMFKIADAEQLMKLEFNVQGLSKLVLNTFVSPVHLVTLLLTTNVLLEFPNALNSMLMDFVLHALLVSDWSTKIVLKFQPTVRLSTKMVNVHHAKLVLNSTQIKNVKYQPETHVMLVWCLWMDNVFQYSNQSEAVLLTHLTQNVTNALKVTFHQVERMNVLESHHLKIQT